MKLKTKVEYKKELKICAGSDKDTVLKLAKKYYRLLRMCTYIVQYVY